MTHRLGGDWDDCDAVRYTVIARCSMYQGSGIQLYGLLQLCSGYFDGETGKYEGGGSGREPMYRPDEACSADLIGALHVESH